MREIKFRSFLYGTMKYFETPDSFEWFSSNNGRDGKIRTLKECNLMQNTGIKDKNGKEIYEGDILSHKGVYQMLVKFGQYRLRDETNHDRQKEHLGWYVEYYQDIHDNNKIKVIDSLEWLFWNLTSNCSIKRTPDGYNGVEIIGNKYENPELLEQ